MAGDVQIRYVNPEGSVPGGHYSHAVVAGELVFVSGQLPVPESGVHDADAGFADQAQRALANLGKALAAAGSSTGRIVKLNAYLTDVADWPQFDAIYARTMGDIRPARCVIPVPQLHFGYRIEIDAVALTDKKVP